MLITYRQALLQGMRELLQNDPKVFLIGVGLSDPNAVFGTCAGLYREFPGRVIEAPLAEGMLTGLIFGAALVGMKPILIHSRINFAFLGMDQIINHIIAWPKMFPNHPPIQLMIRGVAGQEGWGNGAQHLGDYQQLFQALEIDLYLPATARTVRLSLETWHQNKRPAIFIDYKEFYDDYYDLSSGHRFSDPLPHVTDYLRFPNQKPKPHLTLHEAWQMGYAAGKETL